MNRLLILCIVSISGAAQAPAQNTCNASRSSTPTAQQRVVQRDLQELIDQGIEEREAKDLAAIARQMPADYTLRLLDGITLNREQALEGLRLDIADVLRMDVDRTYSRIQCLYLAGKQATVYTKQQYVRTVPDRKDGSPHEVITSVKHRETWAYTGDGWVVKHIQELEQGQTYLDGELYDPQ